ncbi:MAG: hypothetical protein GY811_19205 [Myxococcales bacterium]|nr:hypothetical protein [Myxococcales bacterium]
MLNRLGFTVVASVVMIKLLMILLLSSAALVTATTEAQACDSKMYNNFFVMADSAERVLVVHATGWNKGQIVRALKGTASAPLPPIESNCDPSFIPGLDYLVFVRPGGGYYTDSSALSLLGDQGRAWIKTAADWIATSDEQARSQILRRALNFEFAMPPVYGQWTMLHEIAKLPMPHPTIDRKREIRLAKELARRQAFPRPVEHSLTWFRNAKTANAIALVRASMTSRALVLETLFGQDRTGKEVHVDGDALVPGADYLVLLNKKGSSIGRPFLMASTAQRQITEFVRSWADHGMNAKALRGFVRDKLAGRAEAHPLAYDAASYLTSRKKLNHRTCQVLRAHYLVPKELAKAIKKTCRGG